eukprot:UN09740
MSLGKNKRGIIEPVGINVRNVKQGLGHKSRQQKAQELKNQRQQDVYNQFIKEYGGGRPLVKLTGDDFRAQISSRFILQKLTKNLQRALRTCEELDTSAGILQNVLWSSECEPTSEVYNPEDAF